MVCCYCIYFTAEFIKTSPVLFQLEHYSQSFKTIMNLIWFLSKLDNKNPSKKPCCYLIDAQISRRFQDLSHNENDRKNCPIFKIFEELSEEGIQRFQVNFHQNQRIFTMVLRWLFFITHSWHDIRAEME